MEIPLVLDECNEMSVRKVDVQEINEPIQLPEHMKSLYERACENLSESESRQLGELLYEYQDVFAREDFDLGNFTEIEHEINMGNASPVKQKFRRTPLALLGEEEKHLDKMLKAEVIQPSTSDWSSAPVLVRKKDQSVRWCVDWRKLNELTVKDVYPLLLVEECMDMLANQKWFSKLDANLLIGKSESNQRSARRLLSVRSMDYLNSLEWAFGCAMLQRRMLGLLI